MQRLKAIAKFSRILVSRSTIIIFSNCAKFAEKFYSFALPKQFWKGLSFFDQMHCLEVIAKFSRILVSLSGF